MQHRVPLGSRHPVVPALHAQGEAAFGYSVGPAHTRVARARPTNVRQLACVALLCRHAPWVQGTHAGSCACVRTRTDGRVRVHRAVPACAHVPGHGSRTCTWPARRQVCMSVPHKARAHTQRGCAACRGSRHQSGAAPAHKDLPRGGPARPAQAAQGEERQEYCSQTGIADC